MRRNNNLIWGGRSYTNVCSCSSYRIFISYNSNFRILAKIVRVQGTIASLVPTRLLHHLPSVTKKINQELVIKEKKNEIINQLQKS